MILVRAIFVAGIILLVLCAILLWYLDRQQQRAERRRQARLERQEEKEKQEHEERMELFKDEEL